MALTTCPSFAAVTSLQLHPCVVTELCTSHPTFHLFSQVPLFPCLQNMLWLNNTINHSLEYPVPQNKIKIRFWVNSNSLLWVWFVFFFYFPEAVLCWHECLLPFCPYHSDLVQNRVVFLALAWAHSGYFGRCSSRFCCSQVCTIRWQSSTPLCCHCSENHCLVSLVNIFSLSAGSLLCQPLTEVNSPLY